MEGFDLGCDQSTASRLRSSAFAHAPSERGAPLRCRNADLLARVHAAVGAAGAGDATALSAMAASAGRAVLHRAARLRLPAEETAASYSIPRLLS